MSAAQGGSRLDRLLKLLESGPSSGARLAAARQLGDLQRSYPRELHHLLQRVLRLLFANDWETRKASAAAIEAICAAVPAWDPELSGEPDEAAEAAARTDAEGAWLRFASFDMGSVLERGKPLLSSSGEEFDESAAGATPRQRLLEQRRYLYKALGMAQMAMDEAELVKETAFVAETDLVGNNGNNNSGAPAKAGNGSEDASAAAGRRVDSEGAWADAADGTARLASSADALSARARNQALAEIFAEIFAEIIAEM